MCPLDAGLGGTSWRLIGFCTQGALKWIRGKKKLEINEARLGRAMLIEDRSCSMAAKLDA